MRLILTVVFALVFIVGFFVFFFLSSTLGYAKDADALVETAEASQAREVLGDAAEEFLYTRLLSDRGLAKASRAELRKVIDSVISEAWLNETVHRVHKELLGAIEGAKRDAILDIRSTKAALRRGIDQLIANANAECAALLTAQMCRDSARARALLAAYRRKLLGAVERIDDRVDLIAAVTRSPRTGRQWDRVRSALSDLNTVRWVALGALVIVLAILAWVNMPPLSRMMVNVGAVLAVSAGVYLVAVGFASGVLERKLESQIATERAKQDSLPNYDKIIADGSKRLVVATVSHSTSHSRGPVFALGGMGLALVVGGSFLRRS